VGSKGSPKLRALGNKIVIPPDASHWCLEKHTVEERASRGPDDPARIVRRTQKMTSDPLPDGTVPNSWPAAEFSPSRVRDVWGAGKYRVRFYDTTGEPIAGTSRLFEVADPVAPGPKLRPKKGQPVDDVDEDEPSRTRRRPSGGESLTLAELLMMQREDRAAQDAREERLAERLRQEALIQQQRDREFMGMIVATMKSGAEPAAASSDLMRRELQLTINEGLAQIRREVRSYEPEDEPDDPDAEPPKDLDEAGTRIGMRLLQELEERAPNLVEEAIPRIAEFLKSKGFKPSAELENAMNGPKPNGRANLR
jgi:hypothetical protein